MIGAGAVIGAQLGAKIAKKSKPRLLVVLLSILVFLIGLQFIWKGSVGLGWF